MKKVDFIFLGILFFFSIFLFATIDHTGVTYDEPVYFNNVLRLGNNSLSFYERFDQFTPPSHGTFMSLLALPVYTIAKHFMDTTTALRLVTPLFFVLFIVVFYLYLKKEFDEITALLASIILIGMPRVFFHGHLFALDFPVMVLYTIGCILFFHTMRSGKLLYAVITGLILGGLLATKITGYVILLPLALYFVYVKIKKIPVPFISIRTLNIHPLIFITAVCAAFFFLISPPLYHHPFSIIDYLSFHGSRAAEFGLFGTYHSQWSLVALAYVPFTLLTTVNAFHIVLVLFGLFLLHRTTREKESTMFILWMFWITLFIFSSPFAYKGDVERNFLMLYPFLAFFGGYGAKHIFSYLSNITKDQARLIISFIFFSLFILSSFFTIWYAHPFQSSYFNLFVGGTGGVAQHNLHVVTYWQDEFKYTLDWMNQLPVGSTITAHPYIGPYKWYQSQGLLRNDLVFIDTFANMPDYVIIPLKEFPIYYDPPTASLSLEDILPILTVASKQGVPLVRAYQIGYVITSQS
jgi:4-amino-4-deoxy-L-arabinose transferase-like glycosyltransferase